MEAILDQMNLFEHCPDCGALLDITHVGLLCAHCGFESSDPQEDLTLSFRKSPGNQVQEHIFSQLNDLPDLK
jgi:hypothetical protein